MRLLQKHLLDLPSYLLVQYVLVSCAKEDDFYVIITLNFLYTFFPDICIWNLTHVERLDPDTSGIVSTLCDHSFQCSCTSKWTYLSCQVSGSPSIHFIAVSLYMMGWCYIFGVHLLAVFPELIHFVPYFAVLILACFLRKTFLNKYLALVSLHDHFVCRFVDCVNNKMRY